MSIPIVIFHTGGAPDYLVSCVNISSKSNQVYLIGDDSNQSTFSNTPNVRFFHINDLSTTEIDQFKRCFVNYSSNDATYEMNCFLRVFYLKSFFEKTGLDWAFHTDSDCIVLENINKIFNSDIKTVAYSIHRTTNEFHMSASIHNALLNRDFCNIFVELCFDIYQSKTKFGLIERKIQWHQETGMPGGICDMTLYYLIQSERMISPIIDLNEPLEYDGSHIVFDLHYSESYGYNGDYTYAMEDWHKQIVKRDGNCYFTLKDAADQEIRAASIHFQGQNAKRVLENEFGLPPDTFF